MQIIRLYHEQASTLAVHISPICSEFTNCRVGYVFFLYLLFFQFNVFTILTTLISTGISFVDPNHKLDAFLHKRFWRAPLRTIFKTGSKPLPNRFESVSKPLRGRTLRICFYVGRALNLYQKILVWYQINSLRVHIKLNN